MPLQDWFLTAEERANPVSGIPVWTTGNLAEPLIHGAAYFDRLVDEVEAWAPATTCSSPTGGATRTSGCAADGPTVGRAASPRPPQRGVVVKGLIWRSHLDRLALQRGGEPRTSARRSRRPAARCCSTSGCGRGGSHHQKFVVLRHPDRPELDVAFVGGIDLCHSRRDDADHRGDPQALPMARRVRAAAALARRPARDARPGGRRRRRPCSASAGRTRRRWTRRPGRPAAATGCATTDRRADPLPAAAAGPAAGGHARRPGAAHLPAPPPAATRSRRDGERSVARGYTKALAPGPPPDLPRGPVPVVGRGRATCSPTRCGRNPELHLIAVVPRHPDQDGRLALPPNLVGREQALDAAAARAATGSQVFDVENHAGTPVYVHAKVCVVDDVWASVGSDNFNRRSWTHD